MGGIKKGATKAVLDLAYGASGYVRSMTSILDKIKMIMPGVEPQRAANDLIIEMAKFFAGILPKSTVDEMATFFGAVLAMDIVANAADKGIPTKRIRDDIISILYASCEASCEKIEEALKKAKEIESKVIH